MSFVYEAHILNLCPWRYSLIGIEAHVVHLHRLQIKTPTNLFHTFFNTSCPSLQYFYSSSLSCIEISQQCNNASQKAFEEDQNQDKRKIAKNISPLLT